MSESEQTQNYFAAESLAKRVDHSGNINLDTIRDGVAAALPRRWSEFALELEKERYLEKDHSGIADWVLRHLKGRAFYHYIFVCYYTQDVTPSAKGFSSYFEDEKLTNAYHRMWNEWLDNNWIDKDGKPSEYLLELHALRTYKIMELDSLKIIAPHATAHITARRNREIDQERKLKESL